MDILKVTKNRKTLLLTLGDSWTFGDSLGNKNKEELKTEKGKQYRKKHLWGSQLANRLGYDWMNIAEPGISNSVIIDYIDYFKSIEDYSKYSNIFVVIVLTETGRELKQLDWQNYTQELQISEQKIYNAIKDRVEQKIKFIVARNFTVNYKTTYVPKNIKFVEKTWQNVLFESQNINQVNIVGPASGVAFWIYETFDPDVKKNRAYKRFVIDTVRSASSLWNAMDTSHLNYQRATKHPTEQGHKIWADYLYDFINKLLCSK